MTIPGADLRRATPADAPAKAMAGGEVFFIAVAREDGAVLGFVEIERCDVQLRNGVAIPCVVMRKDLTGPAAAG